MSQPPWIPPTAGEAGDGHDPPARPAVRQRGLLPRHAQQRRRGAPPPDDLWGGPGTPDPWSGGADQPWATSVQHRPLGRREERVGRGARRHRRSGRLRTGVPRPGAAARARARPARTPHRARRPTGPAAVGVRHPRRAAEPHRRGLRRPRATPTPRPVGRTGRAEPRLDAGAGYAPPGPAGSQPAAVPPAAVRPDAGPPARPARPHSPRPLRSSAHRGSRPVSRRRSPASRRRPPPVSRTSPAAVTAWVRPFRTRAVRRRAAGAAAPRARPSTPDRDLARPTPRRAAPGHDRRTRPHAAAAAAASCPTRCPRCRSTRPGSHRPRYPDGGPGTAPGTTRPRRTGLGRPAAGSRSRRPGRADQPPTGRQGAAPTRRAAPRHRRRCRVRRTCWSAAGRGAGEARDLGLARAARPDGAAARTSPSRRRPSSPTGRRGSTPSAGSPGP